MSRPSKSRSRKLGLQAGERSKEAQCETGAIQRQEIQTDFQNEASQARVTQHRAETPESSGHN